MHDIVIRNGQLVDGSGEPAHVGDVAITGGIISAVGNAPGDDLGSARRTVDAEGLLVTPGFVDVHTHYDAQASWDPWLTPSSWHGCTTVVMGNCGVGFAPAQPHAHEWLIGLMEGVEDIPGAAMVDGITWEWETFPQYLDALDARQYAMDVGTQVAHGPLRAYVMGERGAANEVATDDDLASMAKLVEEGLRCGALGFSTSRTPLHKSITGELVPGTTCSVDELHALGDPLGRVGHGVFQGAFWHPDVPMELTWMEELATRTGRPVVFNFSQVNAHSEVWRTVATALTDFHQRGIPVLGQVAGRSIGILMSVDGSSHPFLNTRAYKECQHLDRHQLRAALRHRRQDLIDDPMLQVLDDRWFPVFEGVIDYEPDPLIASVRARAAAAGVTSQVLIVDHLCAEDRGNFLYFPLFNYTAGDLSVVEQLQRHPATRMGLGDAGAHCGAICDGGTPTFMLTHWTRDRTRGPLLDLEYIVHRQTRQTATLYGLNDRGLLAPGMRADINLIDYESLNFGPAAMVYDLPGGARRLAQRGIGYRAVFCNGRQTVADDEPTGELPGRLVRGPQG